MSLTIVALAMMLLSAPGMARRAARRVSAADWARASCAFLALGIGALVVGLLLAAAPTVLATLGRRVVASTCEHTLDHLAPGGSATGWAAAVALGLLAVIGLRALVQTRRQLRAAEVESWLGQHIDRGDFELVVLPTEELAAVGVPSPRPQVVISEGLIRILSPVELEAVIDHEAAHHRLGHHRYVILASMVERTLGWFPPVRQGATALRDALEGWADDTATGTTRGRSATLRSAIVAVACAKVITGRPRFDTRTAVLERAERLTGSRGKGLAPTSARVFGFLGLVAIVAVVLAASWVTTSHHAFALAYCAT